MNSDNGWAEYSRLVLKELETLAQGIKELNDNLGDVKREIAEIRAREDKVQELVKWKEGRSMSTHSDNSWPDGSQKNHPTSFRTWSAIFYINDDYEGGEIEFPLKKFTYKPKSNSLVVFPSTSEYLHGVKEVTKGTRYTVAIWYTQNFAHIEI